MEEQINSNGFDQKPIGGANQMMIDQYPPDFDPNAIFNEGKPEPLPIGKRILSKVFKIKKQALEQLLNNINDKPEQYEQHDVNIVKLLADSNIQCQVLALKIINKYLQLKSEYKGQVKTLLKNVMQKIMVLEKEDVLSFGKQILFWLMDHRCQDLLINQVNQYILNKNPKIVAASLLFIKDLLQNYGHRRLKQMEPFSKHFTLLANNVRPVAKSQSVQLFKEVFKWMGENVFQFNMHLQVKGQIVKWSKNYQRQPMHAIRGLTKEDGHKKVMMIQEEQEDGAPVDILNHFDSRWVDRVLQMDKWKEKKKQLDDLIKKTKPSNLVPRQTSHFITLIKRLLNQNNINLLQCGFKIVKNLCKGLKKHFSIPAKVCLPYVFQKLKDSKSMIIEQAIQTLKIMLSSIHVDEMYDEIKLGLNDKSPIMRLHTLKFTKIIIQKKDQKTVIILKHLIDFFVKMNLDGSNQVRDLSLDCLCKIKQHHGMKLFGDKLKTLPQKKINQIQATSTIENIQSRVQDEDQLPINPYRPPQKINKNQTQKVNNIKTSSSIPSLNPNNANLKSSHKEIESSYSLQQYQNQQTLKIAKKGSLTLVNSNNPHVNNSGPQPVMIPLNLLQDLSSLKQSVRQTAYDKILGMKNLTHDAIWTLKNRSMKESSPNVLKVLINIMKKMFNTQYVNLQTVQYLNMHDWRKCKGLLTQFFSGHSLTMQALQFVKAQGLLKQSAHKQPQTTIMGNNNQKLGSTSLTSNLQNNIPTQTSIRTFFNAISNNISRFTNPLAQNKIAAARELMGYLQNIPKLQQTDFNPNNSFNLDIMIKFYNVLKHRLIQGDEQVYKQYANFTIQLIRKGVIDGKRGAKAIFPSLLLRLVEHQQIFLPIIRQLAIASPKYIFQYFSIQLCRQNLTPILVPFLFQMNDIFIANADHRSFILSLLTLIAKQDLEYSLKQKCQMILDQIVELNGQTILQNVAKQSRLKGIEKYLKKWNINLESQRQFVIEEKQRLMSKEDRLRNLSNWPLNPSQSHIRQLILIFQALGEPFSILNSTFRLSCLKFQILKKLDDNLIRQNTDLFIQWVFWRVFVQSPEDLQKILNFLQRIVDGFWAELTKPELIIILGIISNCLQYNIGNKQSIFEIHRKFIQKSDTLQQRSFTFWSNHFTQSNTEYIDKILQLLKQSYVNKELSGQELTNLARVPQANKNIAFRQYLERRHNKRMLPIFGFKFDQANQNSKGNTFLLSKNQFQFACDMEPTQRSYYCQIFQKYSDEVSQRINLLLESYPQLKIMELHLKIIESVAIPFLSQEIPYINVHNYLKNLERNLMFFCSPSGEGGQRVAPYLLNLTRDFIFLLLDLSQTKIDSKDQLMKLVNKILLILLDHMQAQHLIQVLMILLKYCIKQKLPTKAKSLIIKSMIRAIKNPNFKLNPYLNTRIVFDLIQKLFLQFDLSNELQVQSSFKSTYVQLVKNYPLPVLQITNQKVLKQNNDPFLQSVYQQLLCSYQGQTNTNTNSNTNHKNLPYSNNNNFTFNNSAMEIEIPQVNKQKMNTSMNINTNLNMNTIPKYEIPLKDTTAQTNNNPNINNIIINNGLQQTNNKNMIAKAMESQKTYFINSINRRNQLKSSNKLGLSSLNEDNNNKTRMFQGNCKEYDHEISKIKIMDKMNSRFNQMSIQMQMSQKKDFSPLDMANQLKNQINTQVNGQVQRVPLQLVQSNQNENQNKNQQITGGPSVSHNIKQLEM